MSASDWMKMRTNLWDDPRVGAMVDDTQTGEAAIVGALYWLWATADKHSSDGLLVGMTLRQMDRKTGVPGFAQAIARIGWVIETDAGVQIVRFDEHNGRSAKRRASESVRKVSARDADKMRTRCAQGAHLEGEREGEEERAEDESPIGDSSPAAPPTDGGDAGSDDHGDDPPGCPPCPIEKIVAEYHHALPMLARVRVLPEQARKMLRARWREDSQRQTVGWWTEFFEFVRDQNPFLVGGKTDFQADLLWLVRPTNFAKVVNGNYQARRA